MAVIKMETTPPVTVRIWSITHRKSSQRQPFAVRPFTSPAYRGVRVTYACGKRAIITRNGLSIHTPRRPGSSPKGRNSTRLTSGLRALPRRYGRGWSEGEGILMHRQRLRQDRVTAQLLYSFLSTRQTLRLTTLRRRKGSETSRPVTHTGHHPDPPPLPRITAALHDVRKKASRVQETGIGLTE
ncbi:uncharacterized protein LOC125501862 [Athalia rosae]|uniref:uncharacterized protein LOC125501862 n=1 Tax=Athalia rosae TaxID=37344 RepID=UPI00203440CE|nr:uncharacterized protein LOC125501862 [Athalia rosae]